MPDELRQDEENTNLGTARGRALLRRSLETYGAGRSILVDKDGVVLAGNKTIEEAEALGIPVEVIETSGEKLIAVKRTDVEATSERGRGLAILDNRTAELGLLWDEPLLDTMHEETQDQFLREVIEDILTQKKEAAYGSADTVPDEIEQRCAVGDRWQLGGHVLVCGDSTGSEAPAALGTSEGLRLCLTDPPFDMKAEDQTRAIEAGGSTRAVVMGAGKEWFRLTTLGRWQYRWDGVVLYPGPRTWPTAPRPASWHCRLMGMDTEDEAESYVVLTADEEKPGWDRREFAKQSGTSGTVMRIVGGREQEHHHAKPVKLFEVILSAFPEDLWVWDPFCGSGTILLAAEQLGKSAVTMEVNPRYCDLALARWEWYTGRLAEKVLT